MMPQPSLRVFLALATLSGHAGDVVAQTSQPTSPALKASGTVRQLVCRGKQGFALRVDVDPSPRSSRLATMRLDYVRATKTPGVDYRNLDPGTCSWNQLGSANAPPEPGVVYFDLPHEAQPWSEARTRLMDTTANAAEHFADVITLPRYLNDPAHMFLFYVDDGSHYSNSYGAWVAIRKPPTLVSVTGPLNVSTGSAELLCRGGSTLAFHRGASAGTNLVSMTLGYVTSRHPAGNDASGLAVGTCAWTDRAGLKAEPGQIRFVTAKDASTSARGGMSSAPAPNAAETTPDANTIPVYLKDPAHYWSFTVDRSRVDSARSHGHWKSAVVTTAGSLSKASPTRSGATVGSSPAFGGTRTPGGTNAAVAPLARAPLRIDGIDIELDKFTMRFSTRPNASPTVLYSLEQPVRDASGTFRFPSGGTAVRVVGGSTPGLRADYIATAVPARGQVYHYIVTVPASGQTPGEQLKGTLSTFSQDAKVVITHINLLYTRHEDLAFNLYAKEPEDLITYNFVSSPIGGPNEWKLGMHSLGGEVIVSDAPNTLRVYIYGDRQDWTGGKKWTWSDHYRAQWFPRSYKDQDDNIALRDFNIGISPAQRSVTIPFSIRSIDGNYLMFEAHGRIEVTRKAPASSPTRK